MRIGNMEIKGHAALAPMAGVTDPAFRELCVKFGASLVTCEMVSATALTLGDKKSRRLMSLTDMERPAGIQIFGREPQAMAQSVEEAMRENPDFIDINMGCPARKVVNNGSGSALMKDPGLAREIIESVVKASPVPVTVKMRTGWDKDSVNAVEIAKIAEDAGASAITVHGRTRDQMYAPGINTGEIARVRAAVSIPVIANGDVFDAQGAKELLEQTGCEFLAVGRGAMGNPWIFRQINAYLENGELIPPPGIEERMSVMAEHIKALCALKGEYVGMREARKHASWYIKGIRGAAALRRDIGNLSSLQELELLGKKVLDSAESA